MPTVSLLMGDKNLYRRNGNKPIRNIDPGFSPLEGVIITAPTISEGTSPQRLDGGNGRVQHLGYSPLEGVCVTVPTHESKCPETPSRVERGM